MSRRFGTEIMRHDKLLESTESTDMMNILKDTDIEAGSQNSDSEDDSEGEDEVVAPLPMEIQIAKALKRRFTIELDL